MRNKGETDVCVCLTVSWPYQLRFYMNKTVALGQSGGVVMGKHLALMPLMTTQRIF